VDGGTSGGSGSGQGGRIGSIIPTGDAWTVATGNLAGLPSECGNMSYLSSRPDRDLLIAGIAQQGLWSSSDGGTTWTKMGQGNGSATITNRATSIIYDPDHPDTFWESGIYNGVGVYRTDDNGSTFLALGDSRHNDKVAVDFKDPARKVLLAGSHEAANRLLRSADGGMTWTDIGPGLPSGAGNSIEPHVIDQQTYLLGTNLGAGAGVYRTGDSGMTWTKVYAGGIAGHILLAHDHPMYWLLENNAGVIRSFDDGTTWSKLDGGGMVSSNRGGASLVELPDGRLVTLAENVLLISADQAATWQPFGPKMPYNPNGVLYSPFRKALYIWHLSCGDNPPVPADAIMQLTFDHDAS
jgi:hypothetical protein